MVLSVKFFDGTVFWVSKEANLALLPLRQLWAIFYEHIAPVRDENEVVINSI